MSKYWKMLLVVVATSALLLAGCGMIGSDAVEPTATPTPDTGGSGVVSSDTDSEEDPPAEEPTEEEPAEEEPEEEAPAEDVSSAMADCLIGTWAANNDEFKIYMESMMSVEGMTVTVTEVNGSLTMAFAEDGTMTVDSEDFFIATSIDASGATITSQTNVVAEGSAQWEINDEGQLVASGQNISSTGEGSVNIDGLASAEGSATITLTPGMFLATSESLQMSGQVDTTQPTSFTCQGDTLTVEIQGYGPMSWSRVSG